MKRYLKYLPVIFFFLSGCTRSDVNPKPEQINKSGDYELDVSHITSTEFTTPITGTLIISHNALAIFPVNLSTKKRILNTMGPETIQEVQGKTTCDGNGRTELADSNLLFRSANLKNVTISTRDTATIKKLKVEMPYKCTQDNWTRTPGTICVGFRIKDKGWVWHFTSILPVLSDSLQIGIAEINIEEHAVEAIGILFETSTNVSKVTYTVK